MPDASLREVDSSSWESYVEKNPQMVFVMYYSPQCPHCLRMMPSVEKLAKEFSDTVTFLRINTLQNSWIAERYGIMATPAFQIFCGGSLVISRIGSLYPAMLKKMVEEMMKDGKECLLLSTAMQYEITGYG